MVDSRIPWRAYLSHGATLRRLGVVLLTFSVASLILVAHPTTRAKGYTLLSSGLPVAGGGMGNNGGPSYNELRRKIQDLPQHNPDLPFPEGKDGRYLRFTATANWIGWNNVLNERLMNAHLAYTTNRAYVFTEYWWSPEHYQFKPVPEGGANTPMPALLSGPAVGGPWHPPNSPATADGVSPPRAVSEAYWNNVCPQESRRIINTADIKPLIPGGRDNADGRDILAYWQKLLLDAPERCIEIVPPEWDVDNFPQVFDLRLWGSTRLLTLWDEFSLSPVSTLLGPSDIVQAAVMTNLDSGVFSGRTRWWWPANWRSDPFERMLAIHLRRGDFVDHCRNLASWGSGYYGWANLAFLPDIKGGRFPTSEGEQRKAEVMTQCLPDVAGIVSRVGEVARDWRLRPAATKDDNELDIIYLLTNEKGGFLDELVAALKLAGWRNIVTTRDLYLTIEQVDVSLAVDMEIARRAEVFIGNAWSSFSSNVIHQRLVAKKDPWSVRFS
ncbi:hypothetical protein MKEN_01417500 [Mycena kentingensis (nom. inval.)]|nr:hypothetical protein MKEN_01417500 [Mycena kentingensis (nom. inval.)]